MEYTEVLYDCYGVTVDNDHQEYRVEASVEVEGELPQKFIFVYAVNDKDDPSSDRFQRVGNPQDVQNLSVGRSAAIVAGETEYLTSYCLLQFATLDIAIQGKSALTTRINDLVNYWINYRDNFIVDNGSNKLFPSADPAYEQSLKNAYADAKATRIEKEDELSSAETDAVSAKTSLESAQEILPIYQAQKDFCDEICYGAFPTYQGALAAEGNAAKVIREGTIEPARDAFCSAASAGVTNWANTVSSRYSQYESAVVSKNEAETALAAAQRAEDEALAAVYAVCPDFDPSSV